MPSAKVPQCPWPVRKKPIPAEAKRGYDPQPPPPRRPPSSGHTTRSKPAPPAPLGVALSAEPPEGPRGSLFLLQSAHLQTPAPSRLPRGWRAAEQVPKVLRPGTRRTGNSTCRASSRAAEGSGAVPGPRQSAAGAGRPAAAAPGLPAPTAPAHPRPPPRREGSRLPAARARAHLRPRAVLESGAEVLGAPSALATPIALHGPGGGSRVSEAWSPRAAGSHRRRVRWVAGRAAQEASGGGRGRRGVRWQARRPAGSGVRGGSGPALPVPRR